MTVVALIPCKGFADGKSRLAQELDPAARRALCEMFFERTVALAQSVTPPMRVIVVTPDAEVIVSANRLGIPARLDAGPGLNLALDAARNRLLPDLSDDDSLLILPTDLPLATTASLHEVIAEQSDLVIVPDEDMTGTNVLLLRASAWRGFAFQFGPDSCRRHLDQASANGLTARTITKSALSFDVDGTDQYRRFVAHQNGIKKPQNP